MDLKKVDLQYVVTHRSCDAFDVGDKVFLKSNPEIPLIVSGNYYGEVLVRWFDKNHILCECGFKPEMLLHYSYAGLLIYKDKWKICLN